MAGVRRRARRRIFELSDDELGVSEVLSQAFDLLETDRLVSSRLLGDKSEWDLKTYLRIETHRPVIGWLFVAVKRYLLLPLSRWLYEYSRDNFARQQVINSTLLAYTEVLARENAQLRFDLAKLQPDESREKAETTAS